MANEIGAYKYFECSAKTKEGIADIFHAAAKLAINPKRRVKHCRVL